MLHRPIICSLPSSLPLQYLVSLASRSHLKLCMNIGHFHSGCCIQRANFVVSSCLALWIRQLAARLRMWDSLAERGWCCRSTLQMTCCTEFLPLTYNALIIMKSHLPPPGTYRVKGGDLTSLMINFSTHRAIPELP